MPLRLKRKKLSTLDETFYLMGEAERKWFQSAWKKGHALFSKALKLSPGLSELHFRKAAIFFELGLYDKTLMPIAKSAVEDALKIEPQNYLIWQLYGWILYELWLIEKTPALFEKLLKAYKKARSFATSSQEKADIDWDLGLSHFEMGNLATEPIEWHKAIEFLEKAQPFFKKNPRYLLELSDAYLAFSKKVQSEYIIQKAQKTLKELCLIEPEQKSLYEARLAMAHFRLYEITLKESFLNQAISFFSNVCTSNADSVPLLMLWSKLLFLATETKQDPVYLQLAIQKLEKAKSLDPDSSEIPLLLVEGITKLSLFNDTLDKIPLATQVLTELENREYANPKFLYAQGLCACALGFFHNNADFFHRAVCFFEDALEKEPANASFWHALGLCHLGLANIEGFEKRCIERATTCFEKAYHLKISLSTQIDYAFALTKLAEIQEDALLAKEAVDIFESALSKEGLSAQMHREWLFHYGCALRLYATLNGAETCFLSAIELFTEQLGKTSFDPSVRFELALSMIGLAELSSNALLFKQAADHLEIVTKTDKEHEPAFYEQALALMNLAYMQKEPQDKSAHNLYTRAEKKLIHCARLGSLRTFYSLACLYSLTDLDQTALFYLKKAKDYGSLPDKEQIEADPWLDKLKYSSEFKRFIQDL